VGVLGISLTSLQPFAILSVISSIATVRKVD